MKLFILSNFITCCTSYLLKDALHNTWNGLKTRNIDPYNVKLIHRPYSESPGDAVSEGVGYGLLVALYSNDQKYFNLIWESAEQYMWSGNCYDWRVNEYGNKMAYGSATDAEQDIALSLIFAQHLSDQKKWMPHSNPTYGERAQNILDNMWNSKMISWGKNVAPGGNWGGDDFVNPGYFAPAW
jgi:endo-1,4-beta-D-glucanase Y